MKSLGAPLAQRIRSGCVVAWTLQSGMNVRDRNKDATVSEVLQHQPFTACHSSCAEIVIPTLEQL